MDERDADSTSSHSNDDGNSPDNSNARTEIGPDLRLFYNRAQAIGPGDPSGFAAHVPEMDGGEGLSPLTLRRAASWSTYQRLTASSFSRYNNSDIRYRMRLEERRQSRLRNEQRLNNEQIAFDLSENLLHNLNFVAQGELARDVSPSGVQRQRRFERRTLPRAISAGQLPLGSPETLAELVRLTRRLNDGDEALQVVPDIEFIDEQQPSTSGSHAAQRLNTPRGLHSLFNADLSVRLDDNEQQPSSSQSAAGRRPSRSQTTTQDLPTHKEDSDDEVEDDDDYASTAEERPPRPCTRRQRRVSSESSSHAPPTKKRK